MRPSISKSLSAFSLAVACSFSANLTAGENSPEAYKQVVNYVEEHAVPHKMVLSSEGEFVAVFNSQVEDWIKSPLSQERLHLIRNRLDEHLHIELNERGFAPAATRLLEGEEDETNYDAIWVRDNVWVYYALLNNPNRQADAKTLLLALWDYYATDTQRARFEGIIKDPSMSVHAMQMPHIRFDGASPDLRDVYENGKPQYWNHRQIDAHGLFYIALGEALLNGTLSADEMTEKRAEVLALYPLFLDRIEFYIYEDAGAWEEIPRRNTSSIGLATRSLQVWKKIIHGKDSKARAILRKTLAKSSKDIRKSWSSSAIDHLIDQGMSTVRRQLALGGESPDYSPEDIHFRRADAALVALIAPSPLEGLNESEKRLIMRYVETLKRPYGVLRYVNDSYQGGNYWIRPPSKEGPTATGDSSGRAAFLYRLSKLPANTEAQWFFDSLIALAWLHLAETTKEPRLKEQDVHQARIHIKRALGQLTGPNQIAADGKPVREWMAPESINTVVIDGQTHFLASPITPLNWAKAGLDMALTNYQRIAIDRLAMD